MLKRIYAEKDEDEVKVDMWCHFGHAYITKVDEGGYSAKVFDKITGFFAAFLLDALWTVVFVQV